MRDITIKEYLGLLLVGNVFGAFTWMVWRVCDWVISRPPDYTFGVMMGAVMTGFVAGSLWRRWPWQSRSV